MSSRIAHSIETRLEKLCNRIGSRRTEDYPMVAHSVSWGCCREISFAAWQSKYV